MGGKLILTDRNKNYTARVTCSNLNKKRLMRDCVDRLFIERPDYKHITITENFMIGKLIDWWLK